MRKCNLDLVSITQLGKMTPRTNGKHNRNSRGFGLNQVRIGHYSTSQNFGIQQWSKVQALLDHSSPQIRRNFELSMSDSKSLYNQW